MRDTGQKKDIHPCPNEDHTVTNIPHANIPRHLITKLRVNHGGDCTTPFTYLHHFYAYLGWQQGLLDQSPHTQPCTNGGVWSPSWTNDDVREQSQTLRLVGSGRLYLQRLLVSLFPQWAILSLLCSHSTCIPQVFLPLVSFLPFLPSSSLFLLPVPSVLMQWDTNEVGLCQANMTPHPNQPWTGGRQEPQPPPPYVLHLYLPPSHSSCSLLSLPSSNILPVGYFSKTGIS